MNARCRALEAFRCRHWTIPRYSECLPTPAAKECNIRRRTRVNPSIPCNYLYMDKLCPHFKKFYSFNCDHEVCKDFDDIICQKIEEKICEFHQSELNLVDCTERQYQDPPKKPKKFLTVSCCVMKCQPSEDIAPEEALVEEDEFSKKPSIESLQEVDKPSLALSKEFSHKQLVAHGSSVHSVPDKEVQKEDAEAAPEEEIIAEEGPVTEIDQNQIKIPPKKPQPKKVPKPPPKSIAKPKPKPKPKAITTQTKVEKPPCVRKLRTCESALRCMEPCVPYMDKNPCNEICAPKPLPDTKPPKTGPLREILEINVQGIGPTVNRKLRKKVHTVNINELVLKSIKKRKQIDKCPKICQPKICRPPVKPKRCPKGSQSSSSVDLVCGRPCKGNRRMFHTLSNWPPMDQRLCKCCRCDT